MSTRVLLLRHAESADPTVFHGAESDVELSARGHRQAAAVAPVLAARRPVAVISSAMRRAVQTAEPIAAACGLVVHQVRQLHERRVGALSGTAYGTTEGIWPDTLQRWMAGETGFAPPGAESFDDIHRRIVPVWQELIRQHAGQTVVVVAHGVVCRVLLLSVLPRLAAADWKHFGPMKNVGVNELLQMAGVWRTVQINHVPESVQAV